MGILCKKWGEGQEDERDYASFNKIIQQVAETEMTIGMSKGHGEDKSGIQGFTVSEILFLHSNYRHCNLYRTVMCCEVFVKKEVIVS